MVKVYLNVPIERKNEAKTRGCKWDKKEKSWYYMKVNDEDLPEELGSMFEVREPLAAITIIGEDLSYGGNELFVDPIPSTACFVNVRYAVSSDDWIRICKFVCQRAKYKCEICTSKRSLEVHERWSYQTETKIQKLERLVCLCKKCHSATHYYFSKYNGKELVTFEHLKKVKKLDDYQAHKHIKDAATRNKELSEIEWIMDISVITNSGIILKENLSKEKFISDVFDKKAKEQKRKFFKSAKMNLIEQNELEKDKEIEELKGEITRLELENEELKKLKEEIEMLKSENENLKKIVLENVKKSIGKRRVIR